MVEKYLDGIPRSIYRGIFVNITLLCLLLIYCYLLKGSVFRLHTVHAGGIRSPPADSLLFRLLDPESSPNPNVSQEKLIIFRTLSSGFDVKKNMEREAKKEAFRKYLESSGVLDALTKVLVALYEENDKPSSAVEFVQQKLGGPSISDYGKLQAEKSDLQLKYDELLAAHRETCRELQELQSLKSTATLKENTVGDKLKDG